MPSRYEGLGLLAIEAAVLNLPVIATDGPGIREVFPPDYPWLARAGDAESFSRLLQKALSDPESIAAIVQITRDFAQKHFKPQAMREGYAKLYEQAFSQFRLSDGESAADGAVESSPKAQVPWPYSCKRV
jgi:glycosyltransferase involved in cell wall biosynthesis